MKNSKLLRIIVASVIFSALSVTYESAHSQNSIVHYVSDSALTARSFTVHIMPDANDEKFIILVENPAGLKLDVSVRSAGGAGYSEVTKKTMFRKRIDMTGAEDGNYVIVVSSGKNVFVKDVNINTKTNVVRRVVL